MSGLDGGSATFVAFGLLVAVLANLRTNARWRSGVLLAASLGFVLLLAPGLSTLLPLAGFLLSGYLAIAAVRAGVPRAVALGVRLLVGSYAWLKQYSFLPAASFLPFPYLTLGLSYIFFRVLHLVIDASAPGPARTVRPLGYLGYTLNLFTFVSGPIQRFEVFQRQLAQPVTRPDLTTIGRAAERIVVGYFKVNVLGLVFSMVRVDALAELARGAAGWIGAAEAAWRLVGCYPFFLYCNFSGYIDLVIALATLIGLRLPENFDRPFSATSFIDFWNRWHITLSTWLKTYVYNPLLVTLMRRVPDPAWEQTFGIGAFFVTFFLIGVWHGRTSEYVVFGILQGGGVALNKLWQVRLARRLGRKPYRALAARPAYQVAARGLTFSWFAVSLIWFWARWGEIATAYRGAGPLGWAAALAGLWLAASVGLALWEAARARLLAIPSADAPFLGDPYVRTAFATVLAAIAFVIVAVLSQPAPGIVYRTF